MRWLPIALITTACTSIDPETARQMARMDPLTANPADFAVMLVLPDGIDILPDGARLSLNVSNPVLGEAGGTWALSSTRDQAGRPTYRFDAADLDRVRQIQATAADWQTRDPEQTTGSLSVAIEPCRRNEDIHALSGTVSAFIVLEPGADPMPLLRDVSMRQVLQGTAADDLPMCS